MDLKRTSTSMFESDEDIERRPTKAQRVSQSPTKKQNFMDSKATTWIYHLAKPFYPTGMDAISDSLEFSESLNLPRTDIERWVLDIRKFMEQPIAPKVVAMQNAIYEDTGGNPTVLYYSSLAMDGVEYKIGDFVLVMPKEGDMPVDQQELVARFGRIVCIIFDGETQLAHLEWFEHGYNIFKSLASPQELFATGECNNELLEVIRGRIEVAYEHPRRTAEGDPLDAIVEKGYKQGEYFWRMRYDTKTGKFSEVMDENIPNYHLSDHEVPTSDCCLHKQKLGDESATTVSEYVQTINNNREIYDCLRRGGIEYFTGDFVYLFEDDDQVYTIGKIEEIFIEVGTELKELQENALVWKVKDEEVSIKVHVLERYDDLFTTTWLEEVNHLTGNHRVRDNRKLLYSEAVTYYTADHLDGKCTVRNRNQFASIEELDHYKDMNDSFWVDSARSPMSSVSGVDLERTIEPYNRPLGSSLYSEADRRRQTKRLNSYLANGKDSRLKCLDLFAGMGGLSSGMIESGAMEIIGAVEIEASACEIYKNAHLDVPIYNADGSLLLERAMRRDQGQDLEDLYTFSREGVSGSEDTKNRKKGKGNFVKEVRLVPDLPYRGEVDAIVGGPPCPGYSKANAYKKEGDHINALLFMHLSYCEYYRPKYFLIENVVGLVEHELDGLMGGTVLLIMRTLTGMGYQVEVGQLQASEYGVPSSRPRVFIWASLPGYPLPNYPQPQHLSKGGIGQKRYPTWYRQRRAAPFKTTTIGDSITDLPAHEWCNTHEVIPETDEDLRLVLHRRDVLGITQHPVPASTGGHDFVGKNWLSYDKGPLSEYQRRLRKRVPFDQLFNHVTKVSRVDVERVHNVPLRPGADARDVPDVEGLMQNHLSKANREAKNKEYAGRYGRTNYESCSMACLTKLSPSGTNGAVLHPAQHRIFSVREWARQMSFGDGVVFDFDKITPGEAIKAIGNAVPPLQSLALAIPLRDILVRDYHEKLNLQF